MKKQVALGLCLAWAAVFFLAGPSQAVKFRYENLGNLGGTHSYGSFGYKEVGINDAGQVVGYSYMADEATHAFVKSPGQDMVDLGNIPDSTENRAACINNQGIIGGWYRDRSLGYFVYHGCEWLKVGDVYQRTDMDETMRSVYGINDAGYLVGGEYHAMVKTPEGLVDLNTLPGGSQSTATGINRANTIVGFSLDSSFTPTACFWTYSNGSFSTAASLFGVNNSKAFAINNSGQAVGWSISANANHAVLKSPGKPMQDLGNLGQSSSYAYDINDSGWVVGHTSFAITAFLWTPDEGMQDLNNLVVNLPAGVHLNYAFAINNRGEIAGYTSNSVFKLTPIVSLPSLLLLLD
jgi:probable HAF family extracellular repeat protein